MFGYVRRPDGEPAPGVAVSNGRQVTEADATGRFELPDEGDFVVLTRPTGWTADPWWARAADEKIVFTLREEPQSLPYEFVHLTDTHMTVPEVRHAVEDFGLYREGSLPEQIGDFLGRLDEYAPKAQSVFITGDLVDHGLPAEYEGFVDAIASSPIPVHVIPGNHDHMNGEHGGMISRNNYLTNVGNPEQYEKYIGPRWYSFDKAGLHIVTLDWHTHELGLDHEIQNEWVKNDLARIPEGSPWILIFHDQPNFSIIQELPWLPVAAFSGHWHTSRVVEVDGTLHVNSPTTFFASLDYTPPAFRRVTWDGERISLETQTLLTVETAPALGSVDTATFAASRHRTDAEVLWHTQLTGAGHRQAVAVDGELVFAGSQIEDRAAGAVEAIDLASGEIVWHADSRSAVKTTPVVSGEVVIAAEVSGDVVGFDRGTGEERWRLGSSDPLRRFGWNGPAAVDGKVYLGDQSDLRSIDAATGEVIWRRTDLSPHHNLVNHAAPLIVDELLVMGFWPTPQYPIGLNASTGESVWATAPMGDDPFLGLKRLLIMGTASYDAITDSVLMPAFGHTTSVDRATGRTSWVTEHSGGFSPATPLVTARGIVVTATGRGILLLDRKTGSVEWELAVDGASPFPMASYAKVPHTVIAAPTLVGDDLVLPGLDGVVRRISLDGEIRESVQLASPIAASLVLAGDRLVAVGVDGGVVAIPIAALGFEASR